MKPGKIGAVAAAPVAPTPVPMMGKGSKSALLAATPPAPVEVVHAPIRALPKSMTVKAAPSNVLPFNPKTTKVAGLLSEAEILKQSKDEYMSKAQLAFFKHRLQELASQLRENAGQTTEHLRELAIVPDPADRATLEEEHALELRARDRERKLLKKVEAALLRIEDGSYGYCEETGDPIGVPRLLARPTATLSIEAQERRELKQKMFGE
jgi:DnaK suppressor protein